MSNFTTRFSRNMNGLGALSLNDEPLPLAIAVSGGSDSMALLHLTRSVLPNIKLFAFTVDHALRDGSAAEANKVAAQCRKWNIPHKTLHWNHGNITGNLQSAAREARYRLLAEACAQEGIKTLLLGHTRDDQAETVALMQQRGAGTVGLAGMSACVIKHQIACLRPLLNYDRQELRDYLAAQAIEWIDDPSNKDTRFKRIHIRNELAHNAARKAELLQLAEDMAKKRLIIENQYAEFVQSIEANAADQSVMLTVKSLVNLPTAQAAYTLGQLLCAVGGRPTAPRYKKLCHALKNLKASQSDFTLGYCKLVITGESLLIKPEESRAVKSNIPLVRPKFVPILPA